jgi:hypothetical protein
MPCSLLLFHIYSEFFWHVERYSVHVNIIDDLHCHHFCHSELLWCQQKCILLNCYEKAAKVFLRELQLICNVTKQAIFRSKLRFVELIVCFTHHSIWSWRRQDTWLFYLAKSNTISLYLCKRELTYGGVKNKEQEATFITVTFVWNLVRNEKPF